MRLKDLSGRSFRLASLITAVATAVLALRAAWRLARAPFYTSMTTTIVLGQPAGPTYQTSSTLADENGAGVYVILALPVLFSLLPLLARRTELRAQGEVAAPLLLGTFVVLGAWTIGLDFQLAALCAAATAILGWIERRLAGLPG